MSNTIQLIPLESGDALFITGVLFKSGKTGRIRFNGKPIQLWREEHFDIEDGNVITEQFHFSSLYLTRFLEANDFMVEGQIMPDVWMEVSTLATTSPDVS